MKDTVNIRALALDTLLAVEHGEKQSHLAIRDTLERFRFLPERDRAFYVRLCEGTIERRITLDHYIDHFSKTKTDKMKPVILEILRMAVYQMRFLDSVPDAAAVNEAVKLTAKRGLAGLRGFVNGVLRAVSRDGDSVAFPGSGQPARCLSVRYSVPEWLAARWMEAYGFETAEKICASFLERRPLTVRLRRKEAAVRALEEAGMDAVPSGVLPDAFYLDSTGDIGTLPAFRGGELVVQDISSQLAVRAAGIRPGDTVIDLCAAPGGKTLLAADLAGSGGRVISMDLTPAKMRLLQENVQRCGLAAPARRAGDAPEDTPASGGNVELYMADARIFLPGLEKTADVVIADLPCSGYGVIGRKPEIRYRASREREEELAGLQRQILANAARYVRPGGTLLFSTCTFGTDENGPNARWASETLGLELAAERQFLPGIDPGDGFYYAVLKRPAEA